MNTWAILTYSGEHVFHAMNSVLKKHIIVVIGSALPKSKPMVDVDTTEGGRTKQLH